MATKKETTLLDSSLNTVALADKKYYKNYNIKILDCKEYKQIYVFDKTKIRTVKSLENKLSYKGNSKKQPTNDDDNVSFKNINRSKFTLQRLVKCNIECWRSFITLTFKDNIKDLTVAYRTFRRFVINTQKRLKDFKYVCVPEYQKNGKVHYHLVTNIDLNDLSLCYHQTFKNKDYVHLRLWSKELDENNEPIGYGYDLVETVRDKDGNDTKKICGYISKYISKSYISDSFFNHNRYYSSQNLNRPIEILLDLDNPLDYEKFISITTGHELIYSNNYQDDYNNNIIFYEYLKETND